MCNVTNLCANMVKSLKDRGIIVGKCYIGNKQTEDFCIFHVKMNRFKAYLMILSSVGDFRILGMTTQFEAFLISEKKAKWRMS